MSEAYRGGSHWCTNGGDEHKYETTFEDDELWQGLCGLCGAEGELDKHAPVLVQPV